MSEALNFGPIEQGELAEVVDIKAVNAQLDDFRDQYQGMSEVPYHTTSNTSVHNERQNYVAYLSRLAKDDPNPETRYAATKFVKEVGENINQGEANEN